VGSESWCWQQALAAITEPATLRTEPQSEAQKR
jgi:hypothetical protein